ncbi:MAG: hypothetical protein QXM31_00080 [Candidatus Woesearchaeota archaeon]
MSNERLHTLSHLVLFLMLFMITLAVMRFSTPTGLAAGNHSISSSGINDIKPFLTAVGLLMGVFVVVVMVFGRSRFAVQSEKPKPAESAPEPKYHKSLADINRQLAALRKRLK